MSWAEESVCLSEGGAGSAMGVKTGGGASAMAEVDG